MNICEGFLFRAPGGETEVGILVGVWEILVSRIGKVGGKAGVYWESGVRKPRARGGCQRLIT